MRILYYDLFRQKMQLSIAALVFLTGGDAAADVPFCLVLLKDFLCLQIKRAVILGQPLTEILVYGAFGDAEFLCGGADGGSIFDDIKRESFRPLLHVTFQNTSPLA